MQVFLNDERYTLCMQKETTCFYCGFRTQLNRLIITVLSCVVLLFSGSTLFADEINYSDSSLQVGSISNYVAGLSTGQSGSLVKEVREVNLANNQDRNQTGTIVDDLNVVHAGFSGFYSGSAIGTAGSSLFDAEEDADVVPEVIGDALVYPNPFRLQAGVAKLGYRLSKDMDIQIQVYDMMANQILKRTFYAGAGGAQKGYNKLRIDNEVFEGEALSSGVYFYLIIHEGKVLAKGKMAIKP